MKIPFQGSLAFRQVTTSYLAKPILRNLLKYSSLVEGSYSQKARGIPHLKS